MEILLELLLQLFLELFGELLLEAGIVFFKESWGRPNRDPKLAALGYLVFGAAGGGLSLWLSPARYLRPGPIPGLSLVLAPLAGGLTMHAWGGYRRASGRVTSNLATFLGGAALLFGYSVVRFVWAR